jgi:hypothetical protein
MTRIPYKTIACRNSISAEVLSINFVSLRDLSVSCFRPTVAEP